MLDNVGSGVEKLYRIAMNWMLQLDSREYTIVFVVVVAIGVICMRGLSARLNA